MAWIREQDLEHLRIEDLAFDRRDPIDLLGIVPGRAELDLESCESGWGTLPEIELVASDRSTAVVRDALVLALHTAGLDEDCGDRSLLEVWFQLHEPTGPDDTAVWALVPLAPFLERRACSVIGDFRDIVLAVCNPFGFLPPRPSWLVGARRLHWAVGDVESWLIGSHDQPRFQLKADRWHVMTAARADPR